MSAIKQDIEVYPFVSVVMPVRNEARTIALSVNSVLHQTYPSSRFEIIVADGLSDDNTLEIIGQLPEANRIKLLVNHKRIQSAGMNRGIGASRGEIIVRVDGHTVISPDYVCQCVKELMSGNIAVGGSIYPVFHSRMGQGIALASRSFFAIPSAFRTSAIRRYVDTVYMGAWRREVFERVGDFDETFSSNEDYEMNYRIRAAGGKILFSPVLCSSYYGQESLRGLAFQHFRYGKSKPKTLLKHPASVQSRHLAAPALVAFIAAGAWLSFQSQSTADIWLRGLALYLVTAFLCSARLALRDRYSAVFSIMIVFPTIHVAWGVGFWYGWVAILSEYFRKSA